MSKITLAKKQGTLFFSLFGFSIFFIGLILSICYGCTCCVCMCKNYCNISFNQQDEKERNENFDLWESKVTKKAKRQLAIRISLALWIIGVVVLLL